MKRTRSWPSDEFTKQTQGREDPVVGEVKAAFRDFDAQVRALFFTFIALQVVIGVFVIALLRLAE